MNPDDPRDQVIVADRLDLVSMSPAFMRASLNGDLAAARRLSSGSLPRDWPGDAASVLVRRLGQLGEDPALQPWLLRAMVLRQTGIMVGHIGFHTAPGAEYLRPFSPGAVEFGFTVFPEYRRRGYAHEASTALMHWARWAQGVQRFILTISPANLPSQSLAARLGFEKIGSHLDEVDGVEDVLEWRADS